MNAAEESEIAAPRRPVRIGVIGAGAIAQMAHLPVLSRVKGAETVALCDNDGGKARALADRFGIANTFADIEDMLDADVVDAVVIATPNHLHEPHALISLAAGVDVLCERPLALTAVGVERVVSAAARSGRILAAANYHRFRSDVQGLDLFLRGGELGTFQGVRAGSYQLQVRDDGWRFRRGESGGGVFLQAGLPLVDLALWLADYPRPVRVSAVMSRAPGDASVEDMLLAHLECEGGHTLAFDMNWRYFGEEERWWFEVLAAKGSARLAPLRVIKELNGRPVDVSPRGAAGRESVVLQSYRAQWAHFLSVLAGESEYEPPREQITLAHVVDGVYRAAESGRDVLL